MIQQSERTLEKVWEQCSNRTPRAPLGLRAPPKNAAKEALRAAVEGPKQRSVSQCVTFEAVKDRNALVAAIETFLES